MAVHVIRYKWNIVFTPNFGLLLYWTFGVPAAASRPRKNTAPPYCSTVQARRAFLLLPDNDSPEFAARISVIRRSAKTFLGGR